MVRITSQGVELVSKMRGEIATNLADVMSEMDEDEADTVNHARAALNRQS